MLPASAMLLGAGYGTRLAPLTDERPKPLVPLGDRPLLEHALSALHGLGIARFVINTHHLASRFEAWAAELQVPVTLVFEPKIRGTAGGIAGARAELGPGPVLLWNGDILATPPAEALVDAAGDGLAWAVAPRACGEGTVGLDSEGRVVRLRGRVFGEEARGADYVGIAVLGARCLSELPEQGCLVGDWALPALARGERIRCVPLRGAWTDIGDLQSYWAANLAWLDERRAPAWLGAGARVAGSVELHQSLVGAKAQISGEGALERVVVWPGATARAPLADAIVMTSGRVVRVPQS
jgi:NDP-sugar pyrophosphorylase family protein